jgi:hypothetical protein
MAHPRNPEGAREVVPFRLLPRLQQALRARALAKGVTVSVYVEELVQRDLCVESNGGGLQQLPATLSPCSAAPAAAPLRAPVEVPEEGPCSPVEVPEEGPPGKDAATGVLVKEVA